MKNKINKIIALMTLVIMLLNIFPLFDLKYLFNTKSEVYADGISYNGQTQKGTYTISTKEQLNTLSQKVNSGTTYEGSTFVLQNNIDFGKQIIRYGYGDVLNVNFTRIGTKDNPFMGTLDGNNKKISNIVIEAIGNSAQDDADNERVYVGFIGHLKNGVVKNLEITAFRQKDINLNTKWHGILVGGNNGKIENSYVAEDDEHLYIDTYYNDGRLRHEDKTSKSMVWINYGDIINSHNKYSLNVYSSWTDTENGILAACAGIATYNYGNIKNCSNIATKEIIHNADRIAHGYSGIVHRNYGLIENCFNKANIRSHQAAGISMYNEGNIKNCYNLGRIYGTDGFSFGVAGGIVYYNSNTIEYSYNEGEIFGVAESGGISAYSTVGKISYCYNKGNVSGGFQYAKEWGAYIGGIVGQANSTVVNYCYNVGYVSGNNAGGIVGYRTNAQLISNCYNAGKVSTTDSPGGDNWEYPKGDSLKSAGSIIGYNLRWLHIKDLVLNQDYYYESEYGEDRPNGRPGPLLYSHGFYTGNSEYININNTYYYQSEPHYTFSGHLLARDGTNSHGQTTYAFADIHGTDKKYGKTLEQMQSQEFVDLLNTGGEKVFVRDTGELKVNNGFPIFKWQQVVTGIEVIGDKNIEENLFNTFTLNTLPMEIEDITFSWKVDDESIVNIIIVGNGKSAVINGLKKGFTTVTVTANDKNKYSVSFIVRVVSPSIQGKDGYYLVGEEIEYLNDYYDEETDPKYRDEFKYIHTYNRLEVGISLDNSLGQINYNNRWLGDSVNSFSKVGAYEVNYRVQDNPSTANKLNFENYRYYSEPVKTTIYIHRKPIAFFTLENDIVTDYSYDLDHSISYTNKGIVKWEWTYINDKGKILTYLATDKLSGINTINNWLSSNLGVNYEIILRVQDMELVWSDVYSSNFKVPENIPPFVDFDLVSNENPIWKFPKTISLSTLLYRPINSYFHEENVKFIDNVYDLDNTNAGFLYNWKLERYAIKNISEINGAANNIFTYNTQTPFEDSFKNASLPWGAYKITLSVTDKPPIPPYKVGDEKTISVTKSYYIIPEISLVGSFESDKSEIMPKESIKLIAKTNKEATSVNAEFNNDLIALSKVSEDSQYTYWEKNYSIPDSIVESGTYYINFTAYTNYGGNSNNTRKKVDVVPIDITALKLVNFRITDIINHFDVTYPYTKDMLINKLINYKTGYYVTFRIDSKGKPDNVNSKILIDGVIDQNVVLEKISSSGAIEIWQGKFYTNARLDEGKIISIRTSCNKGTIIYDYNQKENWDGRSLIIKGSVLQDGRINLTN